MEEGIKARPPSIVKHSVPSETLKCKSHTLADLNSSQSGKEAPYVIVDVKPLAEASLIHSRQESYYAMGLRNKCQKVRQGQVETGKAWRWGQARYDGKTWKGFSCGTAHILKRYSDYSEK